MDQPTEGIEKWILEKKKEEKSKSGKWIGLAWLGLIIMIMIAIVIGQAVIRGGGGLAFSLIISLGIVIFLLSGILRTPSMEVWMIEVGGIYYTEWGSGTYLLLRGIMKIAGEISMKEIPLSLFIEGEEITVRREKLKVKATATIKVKYPFLIQYSVEGGFEELKKLIRGTLQDGLQTLMKERDYDVDQAIALKGGDVREAISLKVQNNFERWGLEGLVSLILEDFEESESATKARGDVYVAEKELEARELRGEGEAKQLNASVWNIAKNLAGIIKEDNKLTDEEMASISTYLPEAWDNLLEQHSIDAVQPTDKVIVTEGRGIGRTVGRDVVREEVRRNIGESRKGEKNKGS